MSALPITSPTQLSTAQQRAYAALQQLPAMIRLQGMMEGAVAQNQAKLDYMRAHGREPAGALYQRVAEDRAAVDGQRRELRELNNEVQRAIESALARGWITQQDALASGYYGPMGLGLTASVIVLIAVVLIISFAAWIVREDVWRARSAAIQTQQVRTSAEVQSALNAANFTVSQGEQTPSNPTGLVITPMPGAVVTPVTLSSQQPQTAVDKFLAGLSSNIGLVLAGGAALLILPRILKGNAHG